MHWNESRRRVVSWIAVLAVLVAALMPALAHALSDHREGETFRWAEVCSLDGVPVESLAVTTDKFPGELPHFSFEHCPYCLVHAGAFGLAPDPGINFPVRQEATGLPDACFTAPHPVSIWSLAHPRAPPQHLNG